MKTLNILFKIIIILLMPGMLSAQDTTGMDMKVYSQFAGYGFFALVFIIFSVFIYYTCHYKEELLEEEVLESVKTLATLKPVKNIVMNSGLLKSLNLMYALLIILIVLYSIIILTSII